MDIHFPKRLLHVAVKELAENYQKHSSFCCCNVNYKRRGDEQKLAGNFNSFQKEVITKEWY